MHILTILVAVLFATMASKAVAFPASFITYQPVARNGVTNDGIEGIVPQPSRGPNPTGLAGAPAPSVMDIPTAPPFLTITVVNQHTVPITTSHAHNNGGPPAVGGNVGAGTMQPSATDEFILPTGWAGNVAISEATDQIQGDETLIEANFVVPDTWAEAVVDVDVGYVNGFSLPVVCQCEGGYISGCNKDLWSLSSCAVVSDQNACKNPYRGDDATTTPVAFFEPCQGAAYTYPNDHDANSFGVCQSGHITCCVGTSCHPSDKQT